MTTAVTVPALPESVADATLVNWNKKPGDSVREGENLVDLETDKVVLEMPAPVSGVLKEITAQDGATVTGGDIIAYIEEGAVADAPAAAAPAASTQNQNRKDTKRIEAHIRQEKAKRGKPLQQQIERAEQEIAALTAAQTACEAFLAQENAYCEENKAKLQQTLTQLAEIKVKLGQMEENWLLWQEELEQIHHDTEAELRG